MPSPIEMFEDLSEITFSPTTTIQHSSPSPNQNVTSATTDTSEEELTWDPSPTQYALQSDPLPDNLQPYVSTPITRSRTYASSQTPLSRRNAFRSPRNNDAFIHTPSPGPRIPVPEAIAPKKSRIPTPTAVSDVNLDSVNDLSALPPYQEPTLRRSVRQATRTFYSNRYPPTYPEEPTEATHEQLESTATRGKTRKKTKSVAQ